MLFSGSTTERVLVVGPIPLTNSPQKASLLSRESSELYPSSMLLIIPSVRGSGKTE